MLWGGVDLMPDPLAAWWSHEVVLSRFLGAGTFGDEWADPETLSAAVDDTTKTVTDGDGSETVSSTSVVFPIDVGYIQPGSQVTLPQLFGGRTSRVISCQVAHGGGQPTPNHVEVALE